MFNNRKKKSQASFEYLAIFAIGFAILIPFIYLFQQYSTQSAENIRYTTINTIGNDIINAAESVYYMGYPARLTVQENFPDGIIDMKLETNWAANINILTFYLYNGREIPFFTKVSLNTTITESSYSAGIKNIIFEARKSNKGNYVEIIFS